MMLFNNVNLVFRDQIFLGNHSAIITDSVKNFAKLINFNCKWFLKWFSLFIFKSLSDTLMFIVTLILQIQIKRNWIYLYRILNNIVGLTQNGIENLKKNCMPRISVIPFIISSSIILFKKNVGGWTKDDNER